MSELMAELDAVDRVIDVFANADINADLLSAIDA